MTRPSQLAMTRHPHRGGKSQTGRRIFADSPPVLEHRTVYPSTVKDPEEVGHIFKSGHNNGKIGREVVKGKWKGFPIYMLTLEERATCPSYCPLFVECYGNNMHLAQRWRHGPDLELFIELEIQDLALMHPNGFAIRLHVLGDFYSTAYVRRWHALMENYPQLHVFGFTARTDVDEQITQTIAAIHRDYPDRWMIRFSGADMDEMKTMASEVVDDPDQAHESSTVCPQQTGKTDCCGTCALCWESRNNITFLRH